jgi:opacity protein-like surface antigen
MRNRVALFTLAAALVMTAFNARAAEKVWSGLVVAQNAESPHPVPSQIEGIEKTLKELFGYNQFDVIGESNKMLKTGDEDWLAASKYFSLHVDAQGVTNAGYELNLKLFQDKQLLLETDTKLSKQSPLVIKGPQVGSGQLLLVLIVDDSGSKNQAEAGQRQHHGERESGKIISGWRRLSRWVRNALP